MKKKIKRKIVLAGAILAVNFFAFSDNLTYEHYTYLNGGYSSSSEESHGNGDSQTTGDTQNPDTPQSHGPSESDLQSSFDNQTETGNEVVESDASVDAGTDTADAGTDALASADATTESQNDAVENAVTVQDANATESANQTNTQNSNTAGDPVKVTDGSYVQNETDIRVGNSIPIEVKRKYESGNKVTSRFGYGWSLNLDERIIRGVDAELSSIINEYSTQIENLNTIISNLQVEYTRLYAVNDFSNAKNEIRGKIAVCEENIERIQVILWNLNSLISDSSSYSYLNQNIQNYRDQMTDLMTSIQEKITVLNVRLQTVDRDYSVITQLEQKKQAVIEEKEMYVQKYQQSLALKEKNRHAMFNGMGPMYEETGFNSITYVDDNNYPHLLYETSGNNEVWTNSSEKNIQKIISIPTGYKIYFFDGIEKEFDTNGFLVKITDRNKNYIVINRNVEEQIVNVESSDNEALDFYYENGKIRKITNRRSPDQDVVYSYFQDKLVSVKDTDGDIVSMDYNLQGLLAKLIKNDGKSIVFTYGEISADNNILTTSTTNEDGSTEYFVYDKNARTTVYKNHDGDTTIYCYDEKHRTVKQINPDGSTIENVYDGDYLIQTNENGSITKYEYDQRGNKTCVIYSDASYELYTYNDFNQITSITDRDGLLYQYIRDSKGNLVEYKIGNQVIFDKEYDSKGQLIKKIEYADCKIPVIYEYDSFGNIKKEISADSVTENEYDNQNRIIQIKKDGKKFSEFVYKDKTTVRKNYNGLETVYEKNGRKDLVSIIFKDCKTGNYIKRKIAYDGRHLPVQIFIESGTENSNEVKEKILAGYVYTSDGKLKAQISYAYENDVNYVRLYSYKNGQIEKTSQFIVKGELNNNPQQLNLEELLAAAGTEVFVQKYEYANLGQNRKSLTVTDGNGLDFVFEYDSSGNLVKLIDGEGEKSELQYSKAGRLIREQSNHGGWYEYAYADNQLVFAAEENKNGYLVEYNPNGSIKNTTDRYGKILTYSYDACGRVKSVYSENATTWYSYDSFGRVIKVVTGNTPDEQSAVYFAAYDYSEDGRTVRRLEGGVYSSSQEKDAFGNIISQTDGNGNTWNYKYNENNCVNRVIDAYGNETKYEFDANNKVVKIIDPCGNETFYEYNYMGEISRIIDGEGVVYSAVYDKGARLITETRRSESEKKYEYDKSGRITKVSCNGETVEEYIYGNNGRTIIAKDGNGNDYIYNYDSFGRLEKEKNRLGYEKDYFYDEEGVLNGQKAFDGTITQVNYSSDRLTKKIVYADGTENIFEYDALGKIVRSSNKYGEVSYRYDRGGMLVYQKDKTTGEEVFFEYDAGKNRTKVLSSNRETFYTYGKNNEVLEVSDSKQKIGITLKYDASGREIQRKYANGIIQSYSFDKAGRVILITQKNHSNEIVWAEGYVYSQNGKRIATVTDKGEVTLYEYNKKGQLHTVYYPYSKNIEEKIKTEAIENGLTSISDCGQNKFLSSEMMVQLQLLMNRMNYSWAGKITNVQIFIPESYEYDKNGNRICKKTPFGTIKYQYNSENQLVSSGSNSKTNVQYSYDSNGNLLSQKSDLKTVTYKYNSQNRLCESVVVNHEQQTQSFSYYSYDAFGRRILVQDYDRECIQNLYDGFSFDVIKQSPVRANGLFAENSETDIHLHKTGSATGERYRYLDDDDSDGNKYFNLNDSGYKTVSCRFTGEKTSIRVNGILAAQTAGGDISYFATDLLGSVRTTTDETGLNNGIYNYDAFGNVIEGSISGANDFGYLGKQFDSQTGLYNYGYRDYAPEVARFTTVDPICDGNNWFCYVNNDPVNFVDLWGLENLTIESQYHMTGNTTVIPNSGGTTISTGGCAITLVANVAYSAGDTSTTPTTICANTENFTSNGSIYWNSSLPSNVSTDGRVGEPLTVEAYNEYDESSNQQFIGIQVQYSGTSENPSTSSHWVGCNGVYTKPDGSQYFVISETSNNDNVMGTNPNGNNRYGLGWENIPGEGTVVPVERCTDYIVYNVTSNCNN